MRGNSDRVFPGLGFLYAVTVPAFLSIKFFFYFHKVKNNIEILKFENLMKCDDFRHPE